MSTVKVTNLQHPSSASPNIVLDSSGNATMAGSMAMATPFAMRNKIINGAMEIDQRNAGASVTQTTGLVYPLDRFATNGSVTSKFTAQQSSTAPNGFSKSLLITSSSAYTVGASEYFLFRQAIEGFNCADLAWGTASAQSITLSFWVRSSLTGTFGGALMNASVNRNYVFSYTISSANTWEKKSITIAGDTTGTWATDNTVGIYVDFSVGAGASATTTAGSWGATVYRAPTGQTSVVGTNGATFYLTGVQLEVGSVATPFERRLYPQELAMCQRYYEKSYDYGTAPGTAGAVTTNGSMKATQTAAPYQSTWQVQFKVTKRTAPTFTVYNPVTGGSGTCRDDSGNNDAIGTTSIGESNAMPFDTSGSSVGFNHYIQWAASAEL